MTLGTVKVGETILLVTDVRLAAGAIVVTAQVDGPVTDKGWVQVFAPDGAPVTDPTMPPGRGVFVDICLRSPDSIGGLTLTFNFDNLAGEDHIYLAD